MYQVKSERRFCGDIDRNRLVTRDSGSWYRLYVDGKFHSVLATATTRREAAEQQAVAWCGPLGDDFFKAEKAHDVRGMRLAYRKI